MFAYIMRHFPKPVKAVDFPSVLCYLFIALLGIVGTTPCNHNMAKEATMHNRLTKLVAVILCLGMMPGCIAAIPAVLVATSVGVAAFQGYIVYRAIDLQNGSMNVQLKEGEGTAGAGLTLNNAHTLGVWPGTRAATPIATEVESWNLYDVITPFEIQRTIRDHEIRFDEELMTGAEKEIVYQQVCELLSCDAMIVLSMDPPREDKKGFIIKKGMKVYDFTLQIYSAEQNRVVWSQEGALVYEGPAGELDQEVTDNFAEVVSQRLNEVVT